MSGKLLFENNFIEEENRQQAELAELALLEDEPSHGGDSNSDISKTVGKVGFAKATLSKTIPAMVSYVQPINGPTGYVFGFRSKGVSGSDTGVANNNSIDNIEFQGTNGEYGEGATPPSGGTPIPPQFPLDDVTTISVLNPISSNTAEDFMITRKSISTKLREVKVDITNEVEQDVVSLFGDNYASMYYEFVNQDTENSMSKIASFFFEYATTQMIKKTNSEFMTYLDGVATPLGTATITTTDSLIFALAEMQSRLYGQDRKKVAGRTWVICSPNIASALSVSGETFSGWDKKQEDRAPRSLENTYVCTLGNMDVYSSTDLADGGVVMGIIGNANTSSIYYTPYNEYMIAGAADAYTGISNVFFRVRDDWVTNPLDTFTGTQPIPSAGSTPEYPTLDVNEGVNSDYIVKGILNLSTVFV